MIRLLNKDSYIGIADVNEKDFIDHVPAMVYTIDFIPDVGPVLRKDKKRFNVPQRVYGEHHENKAMVTESFKATDKSLGVILSGSKGTGKTLLAEDVGNHCIAQDYPVIVVSERVPAKVIKAFATLCAPCMVFFDEFGKMYDTEEGEQNEMLALFSSSDLKQVLFVITENSTESLSPYLKDRPGRFYYHFRYNNISEAVVDELCEEYRLDESYREVLRVYAGGKTSSEGVVSFDILHTAIQEAVRAPDMDTWYRRIAKVNIPNLLTKSVINYDLYINDVLDEDDAAIEVSWRERRVRVQSQTSQHESFTFAIGEGEKVSSGSSNGQCSEFAYKHGTITIKYTTGWIMCMQDLVDSWTSVCSNISQDKKVAEMRREQEEYIKRNQDQGRPWKMSPPGPGAVGYNIRNGVGSPVHPNTHDDDMYQNTVSGAGSMVSRPTLQSTKAFRQKHNRTNW